MQLVVDTLHAVDVAALLILMRVAFVELCRRRAWTQIPDGDRVLGLENPSSPPPKGGQLRCSAARPILAIGPE
jgi:hypothetical protein